MAQSFMMEDGGDQDTGLTIALLAVTVALSVLSIRFTLNNIAIPVGPLIVLLLTRFAYKRHFRKLLARHRLDQVSSDSDTIGGFN